MEKRIVDLDIAIRSALHHEEPDMTRSISLISELQQLAIQPLMLKKIPNIVMTLRKVRKYIGPVTPHPDPKVYTEISTSSSFVYFREVTNAFTIITCDYGRAYRWLSRLSI